MPSQSKLHKQIYYTHYCSCHSAKCCHAKVSYTDELIYYTDYYSFLVILVSVILPNVVTPVYLTHVIMFPTLFPDQPCSSGLFYWSQQPSQSLRLNSSSKGVWISVFWMTTADHHAAKIFTPKIASRDQCYKQLLPKIIVRHPLHL